jgi:FtsP/CotA-like multicopper oxidase with cupredoxin domain
MHSLFRTSLFAALVCSTSIVQASQCPSTNTIAAPADFVWTFQSTPEPHYVGTLVYDQYTFVTDSGDTLTTRAYGQDLGGNVNLSIPGPTIRMTPGNKYVLRYENRLPYQAPSPEHNVLKDADISNLHTHGLHISGETPGDDVTRFFEGGFGGDFVYDISADHMGGTYWYHAHHHGSTFLQVSTGGFGLIVIDDVYIEDNDPATIAVPAEVAGMADRDLVIGFLDPNNSGVSGDTLIDGTLGPTWTVNGAVNGNLCMPQNEWQHWRVLLADADSRPKDVAVNGQCEVQLMARDGVWRTEVPKAIPTNTVNLTGASRADLAVRCQGDATITVANTVVANVYADDALPSDTTVSPFDSGNTWMSNRPVYLRDLRDVPNNQLNTETVRMGARTINGSKFDMETPTFELPADKVQSWGLNGARQHPFHLHIYHIQADGTCGDYEDGEFYDVISENCQLRFDLNAATSSVFVGKTIMHCHVLEHEDQGAMGWLKVVNPTSGAQAIPAPTFPADGNGGTPYSARYSLDGPPLTPPNAPSSLVATSVSSAQVDLAWSDNSDNEDRFWIVRSDNGAAFEQIDEVGANVTTYADSSVVAEENYDYRVYANNTAGDSDLSNVLSISTPPVTGGTALALGSLVVTAEGVGQGFKRGRADVVVVDDQNNLVEGATVTGLFSGTFNSDPESPPSGNTDAAGAVTLATFDSAKGKVSVTFCITSITHPTLSDYAGTPADCASN